MQSIVGWHKCTCEASAWAGVEVRLEQILEVVASFYMCMWRRVRSYHRRRLGDPIKRTAGCNSSLQFLRGNASATAA